MAFSATDLANVEAAIIALATGTREVSVSWNGKSITYAEADINKLEALATSIKSSLGIIITRAYGRNMKRGLI